MANEIWTDQGTTITFKPSGGTVAFACTSLANGQGRISAQHDWGANPRPTKYYWKAVTKLGAAGSAGTVVEVYLAQSDGSSVDSNFSTSDQTFTDGNLRYNLLRIGSIINDATAGALITSGVVELYQQHVQVAWWNASGQALSATGSDHTFKLTPFYEEIQ